MPKLGKYPTRIGGSRYTREKLIYPCNDGELTYKYNGTIFVVCVLLNYKDQEP